MELHFPLILDGATGTELQKRGYTGDVSAEQWVLAHPDSILSIQRDYVAAGSPGALHPHLRRQCREAGGARRNGGHRRL